MGFGCSILLVRAIEGVQGFISGRFSRSDRLLLPAGWFVPFLEFWETVVGLGLLFGKGLRFVLLLFFMQMAGTFWVLLFHPELSFQNANPLHLTVLGEFVVKNLVLIADGLVVGAPCGKSSPNCSFPLLLIFE